MAEQLKKAVLFEVSWESKDSPPKPVKSGKRIDVQFNPQNLKLTYANENKGDNQSKGASQQFVGSGTTKLAVELLFDTTQNSKDGKDVDVRKQTDTIAYFMKAKPDPKSKMTPPGIAFEWGTFVFAGIVDSLQITLDYFSEIGVPLRATLSLGITGIDTIVEQKDSGKKGGKPGLLPMTPARTNDNVVNMAGREGNSGAWKAIAAANNIDNPLRLEPGMLLDLSAGASANAGVSLGGQGSIGASAGISGGIGFSAGLGAGVGFGAGAGVGFGASAGISAGISAGAGIGGGVSAGFGANAGAGISAGAGIGGGFGASAGVGAGAGIGASAGVSVGFGGSISANAGAGVSGQASVVAGGGFGAGVDIPGR